MKRAIVVLSLGSAVAAAALAQPRSTVFAPAEGNDLSVGVADHSSRALEWAKQGATRDVHNDYSVLLEHLGLTVEKRDALVALLIEERFAATSVAAHGQIIKESKATNEEDRSSNIAMTIGYVKLQEFLALERNLPAYSEVRRITSLLERKGAPITSAQRDKLLEILIETRGRYLAEPASALAGPDSRSLEHLDQELTQLNEYERHVMELAPAVLTPTQVVYLRCSFRRGSTSTVIDDPAVASAPPRSAA